MIAGHSGLYGVCICRESGRDNRFGVNQQVGENREISAGMIRPY